MNAAIDLQQSHYDYILLSISFFIAINSSIYIYFFSGIREADINVAEGKKRAKVLNSEAFQIEQINIANGTLFTMIKLSKIQLIFHKFCVEFNLRN